MCGVACCFSGGGSGGSGGGEGCGCAAVAAASKDGKDGADDGFGITCGLGDFLSPESTASPAASVSLWPVVMVLVLVTVLVLALVLSLDVLLVLGAELSAFCFSSLAPYKCCCMSSTPNELVHILPSAVGTASLLTSRAAKTVFLL